MTTAAEIQAVMDATWKVLELGADMALADSGFMAALEGEDAAYKAGLEYDMAHGMWTPPYWDRRARKKATNKARKAARRAWYAGK